MRLTVSDPEVVPGIGILRIDAQGLAIGLDGVVVALEVAVSDPEAVPGIGIFRFAFRPLPAPIKHPLPVLHLFKGDGTLQPFGLAATLGGRFAARLDLAYPLHGHGEIQALPTFDVKGGQADQPTFPIEQAPAARTGRDGRRGLNQGWRSAPELRNDAVGKGKFQALRRSHGINRVPHLEACRLAELRWFPCNTLGIEEADVLVAVFRIQGGGDKLFAPAHLVGGTPFHDVAVGGDLPGREQHPAPLAFHLALGVQGLHHNNGILDLVEDLGGRKGVDRHGQDREEEYSTDQPYNRRYIHPYPLSILPFMSGNHEDHNFYRDFPDNAAHGNPDYPWDAQVYRRPSRLRTVSGIL